MNYTENYRLNQWDPEDRILREDFNRDNANVESGLTTLKQGLETETQSREAAVSAARQEATQAVNAAKQEASQALAAATGALESSKADKTALAQLQALVDAMPFVKLREITVDPGGVNQVDVDVSQLQWSQYAYILFRIKLMEGAGTIKLLVNGQTDYVYKSDNRNQQYLQAFGGIHPTLSAFTATQIYFMEERGFITSLRMDVDGYTGSGHVFGGSPHPDKIPAAAVQTLNFVAENGKMFSQGGKINIYGVKL